MGGSFREKGVIPLPWVGSRRESPGGGPAHAEECSKVKKSDKVKGERGHGKGARSRGCRLWACKPVQAPGKLIPSHLGTPEPGIDNCTLQCQYLLHLLAPRDLCSDNSRG